MGWLYRPFPLGCGLQPQLFLSLIELQLMATTAAVSCKIRLPCAIGFQHSEIVTWLRFRRGCRGVSRLQEPPSEKNWLRPPSSAKWVSSSEQTGPSEEDNINGLLQTKHPSLLLPRPVDVVFGRTEYPSSQNTRSQQKFAKHRSGPIGFKTFWKVKNFDSERMVVSEWNDGCRYLPCHKMHLAKHAG